MIWNVPARKLGFLISAALLVAPASQAQNQQPVPIYTPKSGKANVKSMSKPLAPRVTASQNSSSCTLLTFEGLGDLAPIPTFQGISLPSWLSIIEDAAGGSGNFSGEPSPVTIAFWLYGNPTSQNIQIPAGASSISFYYSSYYPITVSAYDANGILLNTASGPANFDFGTSVYDIWSPIEVKSTDGSSIVSITITGYANYTGIDNLNVCQVTAIDSVEITQAIQQYQSLDDLKASLQANGEPPVPIISNKPAVLRAYFDKVEDVTNVTVRLSGVSNETKTLALQPNCADADQRAGNNGCPSMDFYFTPPSGSWQATLDVLDDSGNVLHEDILNVNSRNTNSIRLRGVSVCDAKDTNGNWLCASGSALLGTTTLLSKIAPTSTVAVDITGNIVREDLATFPGGVDDWWNAAIRDVDAYYGLFDAVGDFLTGRYTTYYGQIRPALPGGTGGMAHGIPSHGAGSRTSVTRLGVETNVQVVAHETGHTLGLKHTNTDVPAAGGSPPGCYNLAADNTTDWPFANNYIQSTSRLEYGFDVAARQVLDPNNTFDIMSYCVPRWISPQRYKTMVRTLGGGAVSSPSARLPIDATAQVSKLSAAATTAAQFWQVRGVIQNNTVQFNPLFQLTVQGDNTEESGTYSLVEQNAAGGPLFTRLFTPEAPSTETVGPELNFTLGFSQLIPVNPGVTAIVVIDPNGLQIGRIALGGVAPTVAITSPAAGFVGTGTQTVSWTISNSAATAFTSMVLFSPNQGITWFGLGELQNGTSLPVNFDSLPGSNTALIQVLVSDGVNTGAAVSPSFTVLKKTPSIVEIDNPLPNSAQPAADPVYLSGSAYDVDDGVLSGSALQWSSSIQGPLGSGSPLSVHLQPGNHTIKLVATDSDGNSVSATTNLTIGGQPPLLIFQTLALDQAPTTCENATITAQPGQNGAPLSRVQYSLDGGLTYNAIALSALPYKFIVPGSGFIHLVARAYDTSGQSNAADVNFFTQSACQKGEPIIQGVVTNKGLQSPGIYAVTVKFTNIGAGLAQQTTFRISAQRLSGAGLITYQGANPVTLPGLSPGQSSSVQLLFTVPNPNTISRFSISESGTLLDAFNTLVTFAASQQVIP